MLHQGGFQSKWYIHEITVSRYQIPMIWTPSLDYRCMETIQSSIHGPGILMNFTLDTLDLKSEG